MVRHLQEGKRFEKDFRDSCELLAPAVSVDRLKDPVGGYAGVNNICDYIVYRIPNLYYFELKSYQGDRIPITAISRNQLSGLYKKSKVLGASAGVIFNYRLTVGEDTEDTEDELAYFVDIRDIYKLIKNDIKSVDLFAAKQLGVRLHGSRKVSHYRYDVAKFLDTVAEKTMREAAI